MKFNNAFLQAIQDSVNGCTADFPSFKVAVCDWNRSGV